MRLVVVVATSTLVALSLTPPASRAPSDQACRCVPPAVGVTCPSADVLVCDASTPVAHTVTLHPHEAYHMRTFRRQHRAPATVAARVSCTGTTSVSIHAYPPASSCDNNAAVSPHDGDVDERAVSNISAIPCDSTHHQVVIPVAPITGSLASGAMLVLRQDSGGEHDAIVRLRLPQCKLEPVPSLPSTVPTRVPCSVTDLVSSRIVAVGRTDDGATALAVAHEDCASIDRAIPCEGVATGWQRTSCVGFGQNVTVPAPCVVSSSSTLPDGNLTGFCATRDDRSFFFCASALPITPTVILGTCGDESCTRLDGCMAGMRVSVRTSVCHDDGSAQQRCSAGGRRCGEGGTCALPTVPMTTSEPCEDDKCVSRPSEECDSSWRRTMSDSAWFRCAPYALSPPKGSSLR
eukprot:CAMPEP_0170754768 /NCGR_PEP_ID=MMETSP0437-20130122/13172_1 /TAXON_ID=0 /ORGANISM="Sexangularia sp." /LENGTH=404 /DNA_ID=CAMNT_0011093915 /DNA_START=630 /DNA_END=1841 /DNA_ORIENTATION=+